MDLIIGLAKNYFYTASFILFLIGFSILLLNSNLIKKIIGMNIMDTSIFLLFISQGYIAGRKAPIVEGGGIANPMEYVNPVPTALILTGIVVAVSVTAFLLALTVKLYNFYGTVDMDQIIKIRRRMDGSN
jgi:multicomponent Na+:H+ antiporter subunit C